MGCTGSKAAAPGSASSEAPTAAPAVVAPTVIASSGSQSASAVEAPKAVPPPVSTAPPAAPASSNAEAGPSLDPAPAPEEKDAAAPGAAAAAAPQDVMSVISRLAAKGVPSVLEAMRERSADSEYQCWCCDALSGLCAGNETARKQVAEGGGLNLVLDAIQRFPWDGAVQTKGYWLLAIMSADATYATELGGQGAVEMVIAGMRACEEDYQVQTSGVRCLQNLINPSAENRARAKAAGAVKLLQDALERNPEDGQLAYRGQVLLDKLTAVEESTVEKVLETDRKMSRGASSARLVGPGSFVQASFTARLEGAASAASSPNHNSGSGAGAVPSSAAGSPNSHGSSARSMGSARAPPSTPGLSPAAQAVAAKAREGVVAVVEHLRSSPRDSETSRWCCDAIYTLVTGNGAARDAAHGAGALRLVIDAMAADGWHEDLQTKAVWALLAFAPSHAAEIGELGGVEALVAGMQKNSTCHDLQVSAVKLLSLLTLEPSGANLRKARMANAIPVIKTCVRAHAEDGTLLYRGVNLLERLEPGVSASMPRLNMVRSASMRAEEMVLGLKSFARQASSRTNGPNSQASASARGDGGAGGGVDAGMMAANAAAIAEVDELAEQVEEESDNEGAEGKGKGAGKAKPAGGSGASRSSGRSSPAPASGAAPATPAGVEPQPDANTPVGAAAAGSESRHAQAAQAQPQSQKGSSHASRGETVDAVTIVSDSHSGHGEPPASKPSPVAAAVEAAAEVVASAAAVVAAAAAAAEALPGAVNGSPGGSRRDSHAGEADAEAEAKESTGEDGAPSAAEAAGAVAAAAVVGGLAVGAAVLGAAVVADAAADVADAGADAADAVADAGAAVVVGAASVAVAAANAGAAAVEAAADEAVEAVDPSE